MLPVHFVMNSKESSKLRNINAHSLCSAATKGSSFFFFFVIPLRAFTLIHSALHLLLTMLKFPDPLLLCFCSAPQPPDRSEVLCHIIHTAALILWRCPCLRSCSLWSSWWRPLTLLLHPSPEYHSDPLGASDRDLCHPDGVLCPVLCCLRFIPGSALLP